MSVESLEAFRSKLETVLASLGLGEAISAAPLRESPDELVFSGVIKTADLPALLEIDFVALRRELLDAIDVRVSLFEDELTVARITSEETSVESNYAEQVEKNGSAFLHVRVNKPSLCRSLFGARVGSDPRCWIYLDALTRFVRESCRDPRRLEAAIVGTSGFGIVMLAGTSMALRSPHLELRGEYSTSDVVEPALALDPAVRDHWLRFSSWEIERPKMLSPQTLAFEAIEEPLMGESAGRELLAALNRARRTLALLFLATRVRLDTEGMTICAQFGSSSHRWVRFTESLGSTGDLFAQEVECAIASPWYREWLSILSECVNQLMRRSTSGDSSWILEHSDELARDARVRWDAFVSRTFVEFSQEESSWHREVITLARDLTTETNAALGALSQTVLASIGVLVGVVVALIDGTVPADVLPNVLRVYGAYVLIVPLLFMLLAQYRASVESTVGIYNAAIDRYRSLIGTKADVIASPVDAARIRFRRALGLSIVLHGAMGILFLFKPQWIVQLLSA